MMSFHKYVFVAAMIFGTGCTNSMLVADAVSDSTSEESETAADASDVVTNTDFSYTVYLDLSTGAITTSSSDLTIEVSGSGVSTLVLDSTMVGSLSSDSYGLTFDSYFPDSVFIELKVSGTLTTGYLTIYSDKKFKLTLEDVSIASSNGPAINIQSENKAFVVLEGNNILQDASSYTARTRPDGSSMDLKGALFSEGPVVFSGSGNISITGAAKHAVCSDDYVRVVSGSLDITANVKDGIRTNNAFIMDGGNLEVYTADAAGKGIKVEGKESSTPKGYIVINGGTIDIDSYDKAITASWETAEDAETSDTTDDPTPYVTINGGTITISTRGTPVEDELSPEGIESKSNLTINGGTLVLNTTDDAINASSSIKITGGYIYAAASKNDAIDSNGTMTISGGVIVASGAAGAEGGLDCDSNTFTVTGGTFIGIGGRNSTPTANVSTQTSVVMRSGVSSGLFVVTDSSGNVVFAFNVPTTSSAAVLSAAGIATGSAYKVYTGGTIGSYSENFHGIYLGASSYSGGTLSKSFTATSTVTTVN